MIYIALPAMEEPDLPSRLLDLNRQSLFPQAVYVCVNQPRSYYSDGIKEHDEVYRVNEAVYNKLRQFVQEGRFAFRVEAIDRFSPQNAWDDRHFGVGWARKVAMDAVSEACGKSGSGSIMVCMDADTHYPADYLENIRKQFDTYPQAVGLSNPYYHTPGQENLSEGQQVAVLHYEVYMRAYALNMLLAGLPYTFTAIGSSMACRVDAYRKIGGISPFKSGEDFYFLQKLAKTGALIVHSDSVSHPSSRLSGRVFFGTGPALRKGLEKRWESYPVYPPALFQKMARAYEALPDLFVSGVPSSALDFWQDAFGADWWVRLRQNSGGRVEQFVRACKEKFDALRALQFLKANYPQHDVQDWQNLCALYRLLCSWGMVDGGMEALCGEGRIGSLADLKIEDWYAVREYLFACECALHRKNPVVRVV